MKITYINIFLSLLFLVSCENQQDNKNYFLCKHIEYGTTKALIVDTENKEFILDHKIINEDFTEGELVIKATHFCCDGNKLFKYVYSFNKLKGDLDIIRYHRTELEEYKIGDFELHECVKKELLVD